MSKPKQAGPSLRVLRVNETLRHELAAILMREDLHNPILNGTSITVSEVRCSPDLRNATAYIMPLGGENLAEILKALNHGAPYLSGILGRRTHMKFSPRLKFEADTTFEEAGKIEKLLSDPKVARDLRKKG